MDERKFRGVAEPLDVRPLAGAPYPRLEVRNPVRKTQYLALFPAFPDREPGLCTCTDFARRGLGDCKHLEAAWRWLRGSGRSVAALSEEETFDPEAVWRELDRRLASLPPDPARTIRDLGRVGAGLYERGGLS